LDEISDFHANAVIAAPEPVLVFINDQNTCSVRFIVGLALMYVVDNCRRALKTAQAEDDRSDDEDESHDESSKEKVD
jgi:hypothetical protein